MAKTTRTQRKRICPFCKGIDCYIPPLVQAIDGIRVYCKDCGAYGPEGSTEKTALMLWDQATSHLSNAATSFDEG